mmetsp:Transcript_16264/g.23556  ORF Transcript_16264/g.23556 Transcript_16264/m.23556 type:complete len:90 (-) Transcript_16264:248-517(-)
MRKESQATKTKGQNRIKLSAMVWLAPIIGRRFTRHLHLRTSKKVSGGVLCECRGSLERKSETGLSKRTEYITGGRHAEVKLEQGDNTDR